MFGSIIKSLAEFTGQVVGETIHQTGEVVSAIASIPDEFSKGYDKELFQDKSDAETKTDSTNTTSN